MCTAGKQLLLLDVYSRKTAAVVRCVQQENSCCCQMCTAGKQLRLSGVYSRKTTAVVGCVQQESSCCCQMCTAAHPSQNPVYFSDSLFTCIAVSVHLSIRLSTCFYRSASQYLRQSLFYHIGLMKVIDKAYTLSVLSVEFYICWLVVFIYHFPFRFATK